MLVLEEKLKPLNEDEVREKIEEFRMLLKFYMKTDRDTVGAVLAMIYWLTSITIAMGGGRQQLLDSVAEEYDNRMRLKAQVELKPDNMKIH